MSYSEGLSAEERGALVRHGYDPDLPPRGATGPPGERTWGFSYNPETREVTRLWLRNHVCELEGIEIDGHRGSDLDPGSTACLKCDYEGPNP